MTSDKVALISGGAKGIGAAIARDLGAAGWGVAVCYRSSGEEAEAVAAAVEQSGGRGMAVEADVSRPEDAERLVTTVEQAWGRVDVLINCAGPYHRVNLLEETVEGWHSMFDNNLHPAFYLARLVAPGMQQRKWGRIINFSMATADRVSAQPQITAHFIAKQGLLVLTRSLARLLAPSGITVNTISPGFVDSGSAPDSELRSMLKRIPAGSIGTLDDVVGTVRFLLSDDAAYINGSNLHLSGAWGL